MSRHDFCVSQLHMSANNLGWGSQRALAEALQRGAPEEEGAARQWAAARASADTAAAARRHVLPVSSVQGHRPKPPVASRQPLLSHSR